MTDTVKEKYPKETTQLERFEYLKNDLEDVKIALLVERGDLTDNTPDGHFKSVEERLGGVLTNVFMLTKQRGSDIEAILQGALDWFKDHTKKATSEK